MVREKYKEGSIALCSLVNRAKITGKGGKLFQTRQKQKKKANLIDNILICFV
jgi:hypothetical protein